MKKILSLLFIFYLLISYAYADINPVLSYQAGLNDFRVGKYENSIEHLNNAIEADLSGDKKSNSISMMSKSIIELWFKKNEYNKVKKLREEMLETIMPIIKKSVFNDPYVKDILINGSMVDIRNGKLLKALLSKLEYHKIYEGQVVKLLDGGSSISFWEFKPKKQKAFTIALCSSTVIDSHVNEGDKIRVYTRDPISCGELCCEVKITHISKFKFF